MKRLISIVLIITHCSLLFGQVEKNTIKLKKGNEFLVEVTGSKLIIHLKHTKSKPITFLESSLFQYVNPKGVMMAITTISIYTDHANFEFISSFNQGMSLIFLAFLISNILAVLTWTSIGVFFNNFVKSKKAIKIFNGTMAILLVLTIIWINFSII